MRGIIDTLRGIFRGMLCRIPAPSYSIISGDVLAPESPTGRFLVVSPTLGGTRGSPNVKPLVRMALARGYTVVVHARASGEPCVTSLSLCVSHARACSRYPVRVVGLSMGAYEACKLRLEGAAVASLSNAYDVDHAVSAMGPLGRASIVLKLGRSGMRRLRGASCVAEVSGALSPTLLVNSLNDPIVPKGCAERGDRLAAGNPLVTSKIYPGGGHAAFVGPRGRRVAFEAALDFFDALDGQEL